MNRRFALAIIAVASAALFLYNTGIFINKSGAFEYKFVLDWMSLNSFQRPVQDSTVDSGNNVDKTPKEPDLPSAPNIVAEDEDSCLPSRCELGNATADAIVVHRVEGGDSFIRLLTNEDFEKYDNPDPENSVDDEVSVLGEPVYDENDKVIGFIPSTITIRGSLAEQCTDEIARAFFMLEDKDPESYRFIVKYLNAIECELDKSGANVSQGVYRIGIQGWNGSYADGFNATIARLGALIVHDTCHIWQWERSDKTQAAYPYGEVVEVECMTMELNVLNNLGYDDWHLRKMVEDPKYRNENRYWDVPLEDRRW